MLKVIIISIILFNLKYPNTRKPVHRDNSMAIYTEFILLISHCPKVVLQWIWKRCWKGSTFCQKLYIYLLGCSILFTGDIYLSPLAVVGASAAAQTTQRVLSSDTVPAPSKVQIILKTIIEQQWPPLTQTDE